MGMLITTATDTLNSDGARNWIFAPGVTDGEAQGLAWGTSARRIHDLLAALDIDPSTLDFSYGAEFNLDPFLAKIDAALDTVDPLDDDYTYGMLSKAKTVIVNGRALGATHVTIC